MFIHMFMVFPCLTYILQTPLMFTVFPHPRPKMSDHHSKGIRNGMIDDQFHADYDCADADDDVYYCHTAIIQHHYSDCYYDHVLMYIKNM